MTKKDNLIGETNQSETKSYRLSDEQLLSIYKEEIYPDFLEGLPAALNPRFVIICAQPGAGKSSVSNRIRSDFIKAFEKAAHVAPDLLRKYHAFLEEINEEDPVRMGDHTHEDASVWKGFLLRDARDAKNNIVTEITLTSTENTKKEIAKSQALGYGVELHVMAVHENISRLGIFQRFERAARSPSDTPRFVSMAYHDAAYQALPQNVNELERGFSFNLVTVNTRAGSILYKREEQVGEPAAMKSLLLERDRAWTQEEKSQHAQGWDDVIQDFNTRPNGLLKPEFYLADMERAHMQAFDRPLIRIPAVAMEQDNLAPNVLYQRFIQRLG